MQRVIGSHMARVPGGGRRQAVHGGGSPRWGGGGRRGPIAAPDVVGWLIINSMLTSSATPADGPRERRTAFVALRAGTCEPRASRGVSKHRRRSLARSPARPSPPRTPDVTPPRPSSLPPPRGSSAAARPTPQAERRGSNAARTRGAVVVHACVSQFTVLQYGVCCFAFDPKSRRWTVSGLGFWLFPDSSRGSTETFSCQASSLGFLSSCDFDFNKCVREGVPFTSPSAARRAEARRARDEQRPPIVPSNERDVDFVNQLKEDVGLWLGNARVPETRQRRSRP